MYVARVFQYRLLFLVTLHHVATTAPLFLGRPNENGCTQPIQCMSCDPFKETRLVFKSNTTFLVNIGPSGQERGYMAITGEWDLSVNLEGGL